MSILMKWDTVIVTDGDDMDTVEFGKTRLRVSRLAFGTGTHGWGGRSEQTDLGVNELANLLRLAHERGVNFWDAADQYGSHPHVAQALHGIPREGLDLKTHPQGRQDLPLVGIFATRTPYRPNPIGVQVVELVSRKGNVLTVRGIDACNDSPVLDIKPYLQRGDAVTRTRIPDWLKKLWGLEM